MPAPPLEVRARDGEGDRRHCLPFKARSTTPRSSRAAAVGSGASDSAEITATPSAPAAITAAAFAASIPAMPHVGKFRSAGAKHGDDARESLDADGLALLLLRQRGVHAPDADVVQQIDRRGLRLLNGLDRQPDDRARPEQTPRILDCHVLLPDMHAIGAGGERDIDAVIDHQRHGNGASAALMARASSTRWRVSPSLSRS